MARAVSQREWMLLGGLAVAGAVWLWYYAGRGVPLLEGRPAAAGAERGERLGDAPVVRLELLAAERPGFDASGRDLFKYTQRPPSAEEIRRMREEERRRQREAEEAAKRAAEEAAKSAAAEAERQRQLALNPLPPPPPQPPPISLKFIAVIGPPKDKIAVFETGQDLLLAKRGETVQGEFKIVDIKYESVVMGYTRKEFKNRTRELPMMRGEARR